MKKITHSLFLLIAGAILLASCSTRLSTVSITKRHYNSGYYVEMCNAKAKTETVSKQTTPAAIRTSAPQTSEAEQKTTANNTSENTPIKAVTATPAIASPKTKNDISKELTASTNKYSAAGQKHTITPNTAQELKNIQAISKRIAAESKGHNGNNHSLLWTIIVILLILWLISFLMGGWGLGGLLNLLLVIALVLIILSLLGII